MFCHLLLCYNQWRKKHCFSMLFHGKHLFLRCFYCLLAYCGDCIFVICCHVTTNEERNIVFCVFHGKHLFLRRFFMFSLLRACIFWNALPKLLGTGHKTNRKTNIFCVFHWKWDISTSFFVVDLSAYPRPMCLDTWKPLLPQGNPLCPFWKILPLTHGV